MTTASDTPRTDAFGNLPIEGWAGDHIPEWVIKTFGNWGQFARTLERELTAALREKEEAERSGESVAEDAPECIVALDKMTTRAEAAESRLLAVEKMRDEEIAAIREKHGNALIELSRYESAVMPLLDRVHELCNYADAIRTFCAKLAAEEEARVLDSLRRQALMSLGQIIIGWTNMAPGAGRDQP